MVESVAEIIITFSNTHGAITGEKTLLEGQIKVKIMPLPAALGAGCGLCLRLEVDDLPQARQLLTDAAIEPEGLYLKDTTLKGLTAYHPVD